MDVCYASCCCSFLCSVFIMSQTSSTMATCTTSQAVVVCSHTSSLLSVVTMAPSLMRLPATSGQHDVVLLLLTPRHSGGVAGLATVLQQQPPSQIPLQAYANHAMGPPQVGFSFRVLPPTILSFICVGVCSGICFLLLGAMLDAIFTYAGSTIGVGTMQLFRAYPWQAYVQPGNGHQSISGMPRVAAPSTALSRGNFLLLNQLSPTFPTIWWCIKLWGLGRESPDPSTSTA